MMTMKSFQQVPARHHEKKQANRSSLLPSDFISALPRFLCLSKCLRHGPGEHNLASPQGSPMRQFCWFDLRVLRVGRSSPETPKIRLGGEVKAKEGSWSADSKAGAFIKKPRTGDCIP
jgi:hypothetical protein